MGGAEQVWGQWVSASLFQLLGVNPILGRTFKETEDSGTNVQAVVLSYGLWQRAFGGAPSVIGRPPWIGSTSGPKSGVYPLSFRCPEKSVLCARVAPDLLPRLGHRA